MQRHKIRKADKRDRKMETSQILDTIMDECIESIMRSS